MDCDLLEVRRSRRGEWREMDFKFWSFGSCMGVGSFVFMGFRICLGGMRGERCRVFSWKLFFLGGSRYRDDSTFSGVWFFIFGWEILI